MSRILHILPHRGGGGEVVVDMLERLEGFEHRRLHLADARTPLHAAPSLVTGLVRVHREAREVDLVHVVGDTAALLCTVPLGRRRWVWGTHGLHLLRRLDGSLGAVARHRMRTTVAAARCTICSSRMEHEELAAIVGSSLAPRLVEVLNGVPLPEPVDEAGRRSARVELGLADSDCVALYLGELEQRKRPMDAVRATLEAARGGAPLVLLVAGGGPLTAELEAVAGDAVRLLGHRDDPQRLLAAADLFVMPSEREGLSLALIEAMGSGLAIVASDGPGNPEAIGEAGVLHPVGDVATLASELTRLANDRDERARLGAAGRARAEESFTLERFLADMGRVFEEALA